LLIAWYFKPRDSEDAVSVDNKLEQVINMLCPDIDPKECRKFVQRLKDVFNKIADPEATEGNIQPILQGIMRDLGRYDPDIQRMHAVIGDLSQTLDLERDHREDVEDRLEETIGIANGDLRMAEQELERERAAS
jgi:hypothetical protein